MTKSPLLVRQIFLLVSILQICQSSLSVLFSFSGLSLFEFRYVFVTQLLPNEIIPGEFSD